MKRTTFGKFENYKRLNKVFIKWKFYYRKYVDQLAYFRRGFNFEYGLNNNQPSVDKTTELTKMIFWFLDLTDKGYSSKLKETKRVFNIEWELVRGEHKFVELYGNLENVPNLQVQLIEDQLKESIVDYFWNKHEILLSKSDVDTISFSMMDFNKKNFLKVSIFNEKFEAFSKYNKHKDDFLADQKVYDNIHKYFRKDMYLSKNKNYFTDFDLSIDPYRVQLLRERGYLTPYDEIDLYINTLGYTKNTGYSNIDIYQNLVHGGHQQTRFKFMPTYVTEFDDPDFLHPGFGFQNYLNAYSKEELYLLKFFLLNSKMFMPTSNSTITAEFSIFSNYFRESSVIQQFAEKDFLRYEIGFDFFEQSLLGQKVTPCFDYVQTNYIFSLISNSQKVWLSDSTDIVDESDKKKFLIQRCVGFYFFYSLYNQFLFFDEFNHLAFQYLRINVSVFKEKQVNGLCQFHLNKDFYFKIKTDLGCLIMLNQKKSSFFLQHYSKILTLDKIFLERWSRKLREMFLLRADLSASWGYYLDLLPEEVEDEEDEEQKEESVDEDDLLVKETPFTLNRTYKLFFQDNRYPNIVQQAMRPYKWVSIPGLQYSPFFYIFNNVRALWFYIYDQNIGLFSFIKKKRNLSVLKNDTLLLNKMIDLIYLRYFLKNDYGYNKLLEYLYSNKFFINFFGTYRSDYINLKAFIDGLLLVSDIDFRSKGLSISKVDSSGDSHLDDFLKEISNQLPKHFYKDMPKLTLFKLFKNYYYFMYGSSGFSEVDWQTELRKANQTRVPLLYKIGLGQEHFHFFSFFSRDFFEDAVAYKSWMKTRTFETPYMEEITWREFTYLHEPLMDLTVDITLTKYKADLLYLLELGFYDIVLEKDLETFRYYYGQESYSRDVFDFQEFTAPFFFFDSERKVFGNIPTGLAFEYVSAFGIPMLDKTWTVFDGVTKYQKGIPAENMHPDAVEFKESVIKRRKNKKKLSEYELFKLQNDEFKLKFSWQKEQLTDKYMYDHFFYKQKNHRKAQLMVLTSIKGSKQILSENILGIEPVVRGLVYDSLLGLKQNNDFVLLTKINNRVLKGYFKLVLYAILQKLFFSTAEHLYSFMSLFAKQISRSCIFDQTTQIFKFIYNFVQLFVLISKTLYFSQVFYFLHLKNKKFNIVGNFYFEIVWYMRFLIFIFKNNK